MLIRSLQFSAVVCLGFFAGCNQSQPPDNSDTTNKQSSESPTEHADPHDVPLTDEEIDKLRQDTATWPVAVERIQQYRDTIKAETTGGTTAKAHRALDLIDYVLQWLPEIAQASSVPKDDWQAIGVSSQQLRDALNGIHANIDDGKAAGYEDYAAEIDAAVETLAAIKAGQSSGTESPE